MEGVAEEDFVFMVKLWNKSCLLGYVHLFFILSICVRGKLNSVWHTDVLLSMKKFCP